MAGEVSIPLLPCASIKDMLAFYTLLGFDVIYEQVRPNAYACVKRDDLELHFFSMKGYEPANSYSTCFVLIPDADGLYAAFTTAIRKEYGKMLTAGIPRMTKLMDKAGGIRGFNVIDPGGNWIRFGQKIADVAPEVYPEPPEGEQSKLSRAVHAADLLAELKVDFEAAGKLLDKALAERDGAPPVHQVQALVLRASIALNMDDHALARQMLDQARAVKIDETQRAALSAELARADDIAEQVG